MRMIALPASSKVMINKGADRDTGNIHRLYNCEELQQMYLNSYVYAYLRKDGTPYYIGKGTGTRYIQKHNVTVPKDRSRIVFLEKNLSDIGACAIERRMIRWYGRKDLGTGILRNRTDGGEGTLGYFHTNETKRKIGKSNKGKKQSIEVAMRKSLNLKGRPNPLMSVLKKGKPTPKLVCRIFDRKELDMGNYVAWCNRIDYPEKHAEANLKRGRKGIKKPQEKIKCPHCNKVGGNSIMKRHHFDNCKIRNVNE